MFRDRKLQQFVTSPGRSTSSFPVSSATPSPIQELSEAALPTVEMFFRNLDFEDQEDAKNEKDDDSDWEEDEEEEGGERGTVGLDSRNEGNENDDFPGKDDEENADEDVIEETGSGGGVVDDVAPDRGSATQKGSSGTAGLAGTFMKIGLFVKRELNKRKTGGGYRRMTAKVQVRKKETQELTTVHCAQRLALHSGPVWVMEFSPPPGLFLATGGKDGKIVVSEYLSEAQRWSSERRKSNLNSSPRMQNDSELLSPKKKDSKDSKSRSESIGEDKETVAGVVVTGPPVFKPKPIRVYIGHTSDVVALSWSKSLFLASGSTDKTCRVWHVSSDACLTILKHPDFISSVDFHPFDDSLILTGSLDKKLRFWDVATGTVTQRVQTPSFITACHFNQTGDMAVAGLYTGHCVFYQMAPYGHGKELTAGMRYYTQIECRNKTGMQKRGRKVTTIRFVTVPGKPGSDAKSQEYMLVTTNESRSRLYNMDDFSLVCKYRGASNSSMQIGATCSSDGRHIICGSEDRSVVVWRLKNDLAAKTFLSQSRRDMCDTYESFHATVSGPVTVACFAPDHLLKARKSKSVTDLATPGSQGVADNSEEDVKKQADSLNSSDSTSPAQSDDDAGLIGALILTAGFDGVIGIFEVG